MGKSRVQPPVRSCFRPSHDLINFPPPFLQRFLVSDITSLNIADNPLLNSWEQVAEITRQLVHLHELNVRYDESGYEAMLVLLVVLSSSENQLAIPKDMTVLSPAFKLVSILFINKTSLQWEEVCSS